MNEQEIRAEYWRLYAMADRGERVRLLQVLRSRAEESGLKEWVTLIDARLAVWQEEHETAVRLCSTLIDQPALSADLRSWTLLTRGSAYRKKGELDKAIGDLTAVIDDTNSAAEQKAQARASRGAAYRKRGEPDKAIADLNAAIDDTNLPPETKAWARVNRGVAYHEKGEGAKATADYSTVIDAANAPAHLTVFARKMMSLAEVLPHEAIQAAVQLPVELDPQTRETFKEELRKGRERKKEFFGESRFDAQASFLLVAREWNSYTPAVPDEGEPSRGGGYFIKHLGTGIVIDPGYDFLEIFSEAGGRLCDVDHIVVTHAHNDHTAELEAILTLLYEFNDQFKDNPERQKKVKLYLSQGAARKFAGLLDLRDCTYLEEVVTLNRGRKENPQVVPLSERVTLTVLPAYHDDVVTRDYAVGLGFEFRFDDDRPRRLVFTGDTALSPAGRSGKGGVPTPIHAAYATPFCNPGADLVVAHVGSIEEWELEGPLGMLSPEERAFAPAPTYEKHLGLIGTFALLYNLLPKAAVVSEFGEEMKSIWIKAVRAIGRKLSDVLADETTPAIPVFAGDPVTLFDIREGRFLCHEDLTFRNGGELTMLGVHEVGRKSPEAPVRPYLFLVNSRLEDESDREDRVRDFHKALKKRSLPHFRRTPIPPT